MLITVRVVETYSFNADYYVVEVLNSDDEYLLPKSYHPSTVSLGDWFVIDTDLLVETL